MEQRIDELAKTSKSFTEICRKLNIFPNSRNIRNLRKLIPSSATQHFKKGTKYKYPLITKQCIICNLVFETQKGHPKEKVTCSYSCSNTHFRSGINSGNYKPDEEVKYNILCFRYHDKKCIICGENKIVAVHHFDGNHDNDETTNLIPMCPTHHHYMHSRFKGLINDKVAQYHQDFTTRMLAQLG